MEWRRRIHGDLVKDGKTSQGWKTTTTYYCCVGARSREVYRCDWYGRRMYEAYHLGCHHRVCIELAGRGRWYNDDG
jgi:hypothetical protein